jgi:hypothetical protein
MESFHSRPIPELWNRSGWNEFGIGHYKGQYTHSQEYGNSISQGIGNHLASGEVTIYRMLKPTWRLAAFTKLNMTVHRNAGVNEWNPMVQLGLNTLLYE